MEVENGETISINQIWETRVTKMFNKTIYKITELQSALSLVDSCVLMRVCKHGCDVSDSRVLLIIIL